MAATMAILSFVGWVIVFTSTVLSNHLFGLHQVTNRLTGRQVPPPTLPTPLLYNIARHPIYLGFIIAFWAAPTMSARPSAAPMTRRGEAGVDCERVADMVVSSPPGEVQAAEVLRVLLQLAFAA